MNKGPSNRLLDNMRTMWAAARQEASTVWNGAIVAAVSGGADSTALLHALVQLRAEWSLTDIAVVHVNHQLRGEESQRDEDFVRDLCQRLGVPLSIYTVDVAAQAQARGVGLEEAGRLIRYEAFEELAHRYKAPIATAHTLSDSAETVLFHMTRGAGLRGLSGIPAMREHEGKSGRFTLIRPLIGCTRQDVEDYCAANALSYVTDSTNRDVAYARNRLRHRVLPELRAINPKAEEAIARLARHAGEDEAFLQQCAAAALRDAALQDGRDGYSSDALFALPPSIGRRAVEQAVCEKLDQTTFSLSDTQWQKLRSLLRETGSLSVSQDVVLRVSQGRVAILCAESLLDRDDLSVQNQEIVITPGISCTFYDRIYRSELLSLEEFEKRKKIHKNLLKYSLNYDTIVGNIIMRTRCVGDVFRPSGRGVSKTVKKFMIEEAVPAERRDRIPILCDEKGIVLVCGLSCDERVSIDRNTSQVLVLLAQER